MHPSYWQTFLYDSFHLVADIIFLALEISALRLVRHTKWQMHSNWIVYFIAESTLSLLFRLIEDFHFFTGIHLQPLIYAFAESCVYIANTVGIYGWVVLYRTFKQVMIETVPSSMDGVVALDVWPPPPSR